MVISPPPPVMESTIPAEKNARQDIEIICVNDGSTDNSLDIVKKWAEGDDRFVIIDKVNEGYGVAMNTGMAKAKGEYIVRVYGQLPMATIYECLRVPA